MRIMRFVILALAVFLLASAWAEPKISETKQDQKIQEAKIQKIKITIEKVGPQKSIVCTPHKLIIRKSIPETIIWECSGYEVFTIDFGWQSPFPEMSYPAQRGRIILPIKADFPEGRFPYFIAVLDGESHQIITSDPDLIIRK